MASADQSTSPVPEADGGSAGEFVLKKLFAGFVAVSEKKLQYACNQPLDYSLAKGLVRGEDAQFDQILSALNEVSSFCLRSVLTAIFKWRDMQIEQCRSSPDLTGLSNSETTDAGLPASKKDRAHFIERRELAVEFVFCLVLVEVMPRLSVHPVPESFIHSIEDLAFTHFKLQEFLKDHRALSSPNVTNMRKIADLYAEVIGVLSQSRFHSVRRRFFLEIRNPDHSPATVISIIEGMSFIRVMMFPVEELEQWFVFLQDCARFFLDCPREKIKAAMSALLVEILLPVAAVINLEASLPVAKKLVSMLYGHCVEHARRARYSNTYIPLATVLLAISEQTFFLNNWHLFLVQNLLPCLKRGDTKIHNIALVSLYRLVWVYMVRIKGESNKTTMLRLRTVLDTLFPRGQRGVNPKEMPLNIFVKLIQFIARERLEYAMQEVILELLSQGKTKTAIYPERMIIGLRAFLMITDSLEKKEGDPPMPINPGPLPSRGVSRVKNRFLSNTLSDETALNIGITQFYPAVRRALDGILRSLDHQVGRQLTSTNPQTGKSVEEILSTVKPKLDLLKTCVAAIPRILPDNMSQEYLTDLLSRLTIHLDHELGRAAANSLHTMVTNYPAWRHSIVQVFVQFLLRDVPDSCPLVLEATLKLLIQFVRDWRQLVTSPDRQTGAEESSEERKKGEEGYCIPWVEACGLVTLCSYRSVTRRFSLVLLKEVRSLHEALAGQPNRVEETPVMDIIELATPVIVKRYLSTLSVSQRTELRVTNQALTLTWLADRAACFLEQGGSRAAMRDPWALCLAGLMEPSLLPKACQSATRLAWPYLYHRMAKAYMVLDPAGLVADKGDKPSSMRGKGRPIVSTVETFLWRNYFIFASCSAPPSSSQESSQDGAGRPFPTARDLFQRVVPLIRWDGEIREVAVTALGLVNPPAFGDLVEQLQPVIHDALEQRKDVKRRRRREALKIQITRVFSLAAEHGCFQHSHVACTEHGQLSPVLLDFIEGIKSHFDIEKEGVHSYPELRLHFAGLIANIINGVPQGESRMLLLSPVTRQGLFYLFATWCGLWHTVDVDTLARNPQISFNSLQAMSALLCCGPVFQADGLEKNSLLYRWLDNMLNCKEGRVQALGQRTVQLLLANNTKCPTLRRWVVDRCYDNQPGAAQLCFHALATTMETFPDYPFDMVTVLHVVLFKTADPEPSVRERAMQLLQLLDSRFLSEGGHSRPELLGCLTGGTYSQSHIVFSKELATTNPELTFPIFSEMVYRFEMAPHSGQRSILQYMVPWLANMELVEENQTSPYIAHSTAGHASWPRPSSAVLQGTGWGSLDGTKLVLHNLLYITAKYGEEHTAEVEGLWSALCSWQNNLRITMNYLARLTCACGNMAVMVQHAKRIMVSFSHSHAAAIITELIRDLQSVEIVSAELQPSDSPPFYCMSGGQGEGRREREEAKGMEGEEWNVRWRSAVRGREGSPVALPVPPSYKQHFASLKTLLKLPVRQLVPLHRCNFALMILSELVLELQSEVEWTEHLPLLLHVGLLGLDLQRPLVYEHSKALLGNLVIVVACKDNMLAALQARLVQQEMSPSSPFEAVEHADSISSERSLPRQASSSLVEDAQELIKYISQRECRRPRWPFADISSCSGEVADLSFLVNKIIRVFSYASPPELKEKWARKALNWATSCSSHQYASQSFQVCRALQLPLSPPMFREILTRLAESAADTNEDMQSYVMEIVLTLECSLGYLRTDGEAAQASVNSGSLQTTSEPTPAQSMECPLSPPSSTDSIRRHHRVRSITSKQELIPQRLVSVHVQVHSGPLPLLVAPLPSISSQTPAGADGCKEPTEELKLLAEVEESSGPPPELAEDEPKGRVRMNIAPLSTAQHLHVSGGPKKSTGVEHFHAFSDTAALSSSEETSQDSSSRLRKGSEPPPSLLALFDGGKKPHKQHSYEEESIHPKQHSLDNTHLSIAQPHGSPKHRRRMRSPVLSNIEVEISRTPSHPQLHQTTSTPHFPHSLSTQPLTKASSIQQLRAASPSDLEEGRNHHSYSGGREDMKRLNLPKLQRQEQSVQSTSKESLLSSNASSVGSLNAREVEREVGKENAGRVVNKRLTSVDSVPMRSSARSSADMWRRNSSQIGIRREGVSGGRGGVRPHSMVETSTLRPYYPMDWNPSPSTLVAQMFWTAVSLLESDFEAEFSMALRLISKSLEKLDLSLPESWESLQNLLPKFKWPTFPGVQALLLKGLTLDSVAQDTLSLLVLITPFCTKPIFDPAQYSGLPLNIMALMPLLVHHFSNPTPFCLKAVSNIRQACEAAELLSEESKLKLQHMSRMFQMYSEGQFTTGCDIWLAGICRYLNEAYVSLAVPMLKLLSTMLEQGPDLYHRPVLRLLYEYLRLQEPLAHRMQALVNSTIVVVHRHLAGPLWKEAVDLLKLVVASSAALVQPPTRGLPVDLGLIHHTLPGPTLQFKIDLQPNSKDLGLAHESLVQCSWKNPAGSQRCTRERLLSVINACIPIPVLMSSPSVVFTDEQALMEKATSASEEASSSLASVPGDLSSQPEAQSLIADEFNFLDDMEYIYDSSSESETPPGPFSRPGEEGEVGEEEEEEEDDEESLSDSETLPELSMSDFDRGTVLSYSHSPESSLPSLPYELQSLSGQLEALGQSGETLPEEEEPLPEEPLPFSEGPLHQHESSRASTLTGGSPESHDVSLDAASLPEKVVSGDENWSGVPVSKSQTRPDGKERATAAYEEGPLSDSESSRDSICLGTETDARSKRNQQPLGLGGMPAASSRWQSEPPEDSQQSIEVPTEGRGRSEPPSQSSSNKVSAEGSWLHKPPPDEWSGQSMSPAGAGFCEPTADERQLSEPPTQRLMETAADVRGGSEPPPDARRLKPPDVSWVSHSRAGEQQISEAASTPKQLSVQSYSPERESNVNEPSAETTAQPPNETTAEPPIETTDAAEHVAKSNELTAVESNLSRLATESELLGELVKQAEELTRSVLGPMELNRGLAEGRHVSEPPAEGPGKPKGQAGGRAVSEPPSDRSSEGLPRLDKKKEETSPSEPCEEKQSSTEPTDEVRVENGSVGEVKVGSSPPLALTAADERTDVPSGEWVLVEQVDGHERESVKDQIADFPSVQPFQSAASRFILVSNEEIADVWKRHVGSLGCEKPEQLAVHTHFLFVRLFPVLRQQFTVLTREACNYLGHAYSTVAAHFLVTVELLGSQFHLPIVYIDSELLVKAKLVESHVFLTLELDGNIDVYYERRRTVLQRLELIKLQLRQQSKGGESDEHVKVISLSPEQATLQLCQAVHRLHFQLLVLLGSYIKLLDSLQPYLATCGGVEMSQELAEVRAGVEESVRLLGRVPSPLLEPVTQPFAETLQVLEDALTQKQWSRAVQLLRAIRRKNRDVDVLGGSEDDDVDCLFFIYARFLTDNQEGFVSITSENSQLSDVHSRLMAQNVSLHSLLETTHQNLLSP